MKAGLALFALIALTATGALAKPALSAQSGQVPWTIEGGTGRFAGATGGGRAGGLATAAGGTVILDGTISSVGSLNDD